MFILFEDFLFLFFPRSAQILAKVGDTFAVILRLVNQVYGLGWNLPGE